MTIRYAATTALVGSVAAVLVACTSADTGGPLGPDPGSTVSVRAAVRTGVIFDEGSLSEIRLVAPDGTVLRPRKDHTDNAVFAGLATGTYQLRAALRPCDANCGYLDPPVFACSAPVRVEDDRDFRVTWVAASACRISPT
jgi:hypothetical protein